MKTTSTPTAAPAPFLSATVNEDHHPNGQLSYSETVAVLPPESAHDYPNRRLHPSGYSWIRTGRQAKYHDNGQLAWETYYNDKGEPEKPARRQYRRDGSIIIY